MSAIRTSCNGQWNKRNTHCQFSCHTKRTGVPRAVPSEYKELLFYRHKPDSLFHFPKLWEVQIPLNLPYRLSDALPTVASVGASSPTHATKSLWVRPSYPIPPSPASVAKVNIATCSTGLHITTSRTAVQQKVVRGNTTPASTAHRYGQYARVAQRTERRALAQRGSGLTALRLFLWFQLLQLPSPWRLTKYISLQCGPNLHYSAT